MRKIAEEYGVTHSVMGTDNTPSFNMQYPPKTAPPAQQNSATYESIIRESSAYTWFP
jgi:hypothetical protein